MKPFVGEAELGRLASFGASGSAPFFGERGRFSNAKCPTPSTPSIT